MDPMVVLKAVLVLAALGAFSATLLATAARRFHVDVDPKVELVFEALPGSNCGACGNPSCFAVAERVSAGSLKVDTCVAGGQSVADALAKVLGVTGVEVEASVSVLHCGGGTRSARSYRYSGLHSCNAVARLAGGPLRCPAGCIGFGDCARACPFDAITMGDDGLPVVDLEACTGCGICVRECPRAGSHHLLELLPVATRVVVRCSTRERVKERRESCPVCCIACKKCEKVCDVEAIRVVDGLAVIDQALCTACGACIEECPQKCIGRIDQGACAAEVSA